MGRAAPHFSPCPSPQAASAPQLWRTGLGLSQESFCPRQLWVLAPVPHCTQFPDRSQKAPGRPRLILASRALGAGPLAPCSCTCWKSQQIREVNLAPTCQGAGAQEAPGVSSSR